MRRAILAALSVAGCLAAIPAAAAPPADPLPRRASIGVALGAAADGGVLVDAIATPDAAARFGLRKGDVVLAVGGNPVATSAQAVAAVGRQRAGEAGELRIRRDGKERVLTGRFAPRPSEAYDHGTAAYGATPFEGGLLRDIFVTPAGGAKGPVVYLIQGYTCDSMETSAGAAHQQLIDGLLARGISTYRIEKPQAGDSRGGPACADIDFKTEVRAFQAGYRTLRETHGVGADRIFVLGHSLGGLEAPLLAAAGPAPRGVAVYGTVTRAWRDYLLDILKYQGLMASGADPAEGEARGEKLRPLIERIYAGGEPPAKIAAASADDAKLLRDGLGWDGGEGLMGRHYQFWRQISATPFMGAWRDTRANVLAVYGESDIAAVDPEDHKLIVEAVNHYRPGTARFVEVPRTGHGMRLDGDKAQARAARAAGGPPPPFNGDLVTLFGDWIDATMKAPPIAAAPASGD